MSVKTYVKLLRIGEILGVAVAVLALLTLFYRSSRPRALRNTAPTTIPRCRLPRMA